jgi:hypothetical protein
VTIAVFAPIRALVVMVGLVPTIHVFASSIECGVQDVGARRRGEHDGGIPAA